MPGTPRVKLIEVEGFRAFPGGHPGRFDFGDGCNLLLFGENGAGKSSLYRALRELFSTGAPGIDTHRNVFSNGPSRVSVTLMDGDVLEWTAAGHPAHPDTSVIPRAREAVIAIARHSGFLTHTALRELIYSNDGADTPNNIFQVALDAIVGDFEATLDGGSKRTVRELWDDVTTACGAREGSIGAERLPPNHIRTVKAACLRFNTGMRQALEALEPVATRLLGALLDVVREDGLKLTGLLYSQVTVSEPKRPRDRALENKSLLPQVRMNNHAPHAPQSFLNEARQTALALAIYLAGRQVCAPPGGGKLKLLVMDDLLISLDASHRRPVLDLILREFADWQVILLTHDRSWFELAREQVRSGGRWKTVALHERFDEDGLLCPLIRPMDVDAVEAMLKQAEAFLADHHLAAACNYTRSACEQMLRRFCIKQRVLFALVEEGRSGPMLNDYLLAARTKSRPGRSWRIALDALTPYQRFVLNPLSHDPGASVPSSDVRSAIGAVRACVVVLREDEA